MSTIFSHNYVLYSRLRLFYELSISGMMVEDIIGRVLSENDRRFIRSAVKDSERRRSFYRYRREAYRRLPEGMEFVIGPWSGWNGGLSISLLLHPYNLLSIESSEER